MSLLLLAPRLSKDVRLRSFAEARLRKFFDSLDKILAIWVL